MQNTLNSQEIYSIMSEPEKFDMVLSLEVKIIA